MSKSGQTVLALGAIVVLGLAGNRARAASHSWVVNELFSNADGAVQFVELHCPAGAANETGLNGKSVTSAAKGTIHTFSSNLPPNSTSNKHMLLATQAFADLPGAPTPDHIIAPNAFALDGDTIQWHVYAGSIMSMASGEVPTDGVASLNRGGGTGPNSPTNFSGATGSVDASGGGPEPAGVPDGSGGTTPLTVERLDTTGTQVRIGWDVATCDVSSNHQLLFGEGSDLPVAPGGTFSPDAVCAIAAAPPYDWVSVPDASDGSGLVWWLVVIEDGGVEGSWGRAGNGLERSGPGTNGSSALCRVTDKSTANVCGH